MSSGLFGNWGQINVHLNNLKRAKIKEKPLLGVGAILAEQIRRNIEEQRIDFVPLSPEYAARKAARGGDSRILIDTHQYVDSIVVKDLEVEGDTFRIVVGVADGEMDTGISLSELAYYIEYGTHKQPGRYPFTLTWEQMREKLKQEIVSQIKVEIEEGWK